MNEVMILKTCERFYIFIVTITTILLELICLILMAATYLKEDHQNGRIRSSSS